MGIDSFLQYIRFEKRYSPHTILSYENDLKQFAAYLLLQYELNDISTATYPHIRSWVVELMEQKLNPNSVNRKLSSLKSYYKFLLKKGSYY